LKYLHQKKICHRDVKPENILIRDDGTLKLIDFGFAVNLAGTDGSMRGGVGTQTYTAPEVLCGINYEKSVDIWSVGATIYTLLSGMKPFEYGPTSSKGGGDVPSPEQKSHQRGKILNGEYNFDDPVWEKISSQAKDFIGCLLKVRPADRISAKVALEHSWITSVDMDLRSFSYQWKINSRSRRDAARRERREKRINERSGGSSSNSSSRSTNDTISVRTTDSITKPRSSEIPRPMNASRPSIMTSTYDRSDRTDRTTTRIDRTDRLDRTVERTTGRSDRTDRLKSEPVERLAHSSYDRHDYKGSSSLSTRSNKEPTVSSTTSSSNYRSRYESPSTYTSTATRKYR